MTDQTGNDERSKDGIVTDIEGLRLIAWSLEGGNAKMAAECRRAAAEIERLRAENEAMHSAHHEAMWEDTLLPIANALGVSVHDEHGVPRRQFQMVEAIIKEARRG